MGIAAVTFSVMMLTVRLRSLLTLLKTLIPHGMDGRCGGEDGGQTGH